MLPSPESTKKASVTRSVRPAFETAPAGCVAWVSSPLGRLGRRRISVWPEGAMWLGCSRIVPVSHVAGMAVSSRLGLVPLDLVEVAECRTPRPHTFPQRRELLVGDLPQRPLHAQVRKVQVLLVHDRRDPRIHLDHVLAHELDVEEVL